MTSTARLADAKATKPRHGDPTCNGCGLCCLAELCPLAQLFFRQDRHGRCPALEDAGARYQCGLMARPAHYAPLRAALVGEDLLREAAAQFIGVGIGCDAHLAGEPYDHAYKARITALDRKLPRYQAARYKRAWGIDPGIPIHGR